MNAQLKEKAICFEKLMDEHWTDKQGCVYTFIDKATKKPATDDFFADAGEPQSIKDLSVPEFSRREVSMYENNGMCTGAYLQALVFRYRVEKNEESLQKARRCFNALKGIFEIGRKLEPGFFPKTYGGRFSVETSSDQCLYAIYSMDNFYELASVGEKKEIELMVPAIADFWRKRKYIYSYWELKDMQWPIFRFPIFMLLAYKYSKEKKFKDEYERIVGDWHENYPERFNLLGSKQQGVIPPCQHESEFNAWMVGGMPDYTGMRMIELEGLLKNDPDNSLAKRWVQSILDVWKQAKLALVPNGKAYFTIFVDMDTNELRRPESLDLITSTMGWSTMIIRGVVQALEFYPDNLEMKREVRKVLDLFNNIDDMTYFDESERFPPKLYFKTRFLSGDTITNWLWAYWQRRLQKCKSLSAKVERENRDTTMIPEVDKINR